MPKTPEYQIRASAKYNRDKRDIFSISAPRGTKAAIDAAAATVGTTRNAYILRAVQERMERDGIADIPTI